jgi:hypothetical protein
MTITDERLASVQVKIDRAKKHIADLGADLKAFLDTKPYAVGTKRDPETRKLIYYVTKVDRTPIALAAATGGIIQNLRSALDHLAYQLFLVGTGGSAGNGRHVYFPIARDVAEYKKGSAHRIKGLRQDAVDAINAIEPYGGGKRNDLWILHALNNIDKHRLIITVGGSFQSVDVGPTVSRTLPDGFKENLKISLLLKPADTLCPLKVGAELFIDASPDAEVDENKPFGLDVALSEPGIVEGKPLLAEVQRFANLVSDTVALFKPYLA